MLADMKNEDLAAGEEGIKFNWHAQTPVKISDPTIRGSWYFQSFNMPSTISWPSANCVLKENTLPQLVGGALPNHPLIGSNVTVATKICV